MWAARVPIAVKQMVLTNVSKGLSYQCDPVVQRPVWCIISTAQLAERISSNTCPELQKLLVHQ